MNNIFLSLIKKGFTSLSFWAFSICSFLLCMVLGVTEYLSISVYNNETEIADLLITAVTAFFICDLNIYSGWQLTGRGIIKNFLISGKKKRDIYLGFFIAQFLFDIIMTLISFMPYILLLGLAGIKNPDAKDIISHDYETILMLMLVLVMTSVFSEALALMINSKVFAVIAFGLTVLFFIAAIDINENKLTMYTLTEKIETYTWDQQKGIMVFQNENHDYIGGNARKALKAFYGMNPVSQCITIINYRNLDKTVEEFENNYIVVDYIDYTDSQMNNLKRTIKLYTEEVKTAYKRIPQFTFCFSALFFGIGLIAFEKKSIE